MSKLALVLEVAEKTRHRSIDCGYITQNGRALRFEASIVGTSGT